MANNQPAIAVSQTTADDPLFQQARAIRKAVFVQEQNVPEEEEWDKEDAIATHVLIFVDNAAAGTARFYPENGWLKIGRVAVLQACRGLGLGHALLAYCLDQGKRQGYAHAFLNAQSDKLPFYARHGFSAVGGEFDEAGIMHTRMEREL